MSSKNRRQVWLLWINYMLNVNPFVGRGQISDTHIVLVRAKAKQCVSARAFPNTHLPVSTQGTQTSKPGRLWRILIVGNSCIYFVIGMWKGELSFFFFFLLPVSNFQAAPVTRSLDFHSFL